MDEDPLREPLPHTRKSRRVEESLRDLFPYGPASRMGENPLRLTSPHTCGSHIKGSPMRDQTPQTRESRMEFLSARQHRENARNARLSKANVTIESLIDVSEDKPDPLSHLPPVQPGTLYLYENAMKSWLEFHSRAGIEDPLMAGQLPDFDRIKSWLRWLVYSSKGRENDHVFRSTLETYWSRLRVAIYWQEGLNFSEAVCAQVNSVSSACRGCMHSL